MRDTSANLATLKSLYELGVRFSMDDFGTGYSSLGYLLNFPFSQLKIERSFIAGLADKKESRVIVRAVADLARNLNLRVVAEGVETDEQYEQARMLGCTDIQGHFISFPLSADNIRQHYFSGRKTAVGAGTRLTPENMIRPTHQLAAHDRHRKGGVRKHDRAAG